MAICYVPATPADGDNYTYDLRPAPMRQEARIAALEASLAAAIERIADLVNEQQIIYDALKAITAAEHGEQLAALEARIAALEAPQQRARQVMDALFSDERIK